MTGRNEPCHCGSGKKYKKCCLAKDSNFKVLTGGKGNSVRSTPLTPEQIEIAELLHLDQEVYYASDLTEFYLERTKGKSKGTILKYRNSLESIGCGLSNHKYANQWIELSPEFWEQLIVYDFFVMSLEPSYNQAENLFSVLKQFTKWTDKKYGLDNGELVKFLTDKNRYAVMDAIYNYNFLLREVLMQNAKDKWFGSNRVGPLVEEGGWFVVNDMTATSIKTIELTSGDQFTISIPKEMLTQESVHYGMIFVGVLEKESGKRNWRFVELENVYPPKAFSFLKREVLEFI
ncbi:YecA family protein [Fictibacillus norfolkensis]|uniref:YecA family protein n=1 Tax=Fictibacillus norfolkensis TaxID=2762233 RepID=UPI001CD8F38E|nr:SEC-C domain-containing protein [Fictibacillus norfolkensis]